MKFACYLFLAAGFLWRAFLEEERIGRFLNVLNAALLLALSALEKRDELMRGKNE